MSESEDVEDVGALRDNGPSALNFSLTKRKIVREESDKDIQAVASLGAIDAENKLRAQVIFSRLQRHATTLAGLDDEIRASLVGGEDLEGEIRGALKYQMDLAEGIDRLEWQLRDLELGNTQGRDQQATAARMTRVKVPKLELTTFEGDPLRWEEFWDDFSSSVDSRKDLSTVDKFKLLRQSLTGEALSVCKGYFLTENGYTEVKEALKDRFGDRQVAVFAHLEALLDLKPATHELDSLMKVRDSCEAHIRSLETLGMTEDNYGLVFAPIILWKLPRFVKMELHRRNGSEKWTLSSLRKHLKEEIYARERSERLFGGKASDSTSREPAEKQSSRDWGSRKKLQTSTAATLLVQNEKDKPPNRGDGKAELGCVFCQGRHMNWACDKYKTADARLKHIGRRCYNCLSDKHEKRNCQSAKNCYYCGKAGHNSSICFQEFGSGRNKSMVVANDSDSPEMETATVNAVQGNVEAADQKGAQKTCGVAVLESALVKVTGQNGSAVARIVFDTGSTLSFARKELCERIGAKSLGKATTAIGRFGDSESKRDHFTVKQIHMALEDGSSLAVKLREVQHVSTPIRLVPLDKHKLPAGIERNHIAETLVDKPQMVEIDVLIGLDYYHDIVGPEQWRGSDGLVVKQTAVGKIVTGFVRQSSGPQRDVQLLVVEPPRGASGLLDLERFWRLEDIGIKDSPSQNDDEVALEKFESTINFKDGRYEVEWPFKSEKPELPTNYDNALRRLNSVYTKLRKDPTLAKAYDDIFKGQLDLGVIECAPEEPDGVEHYLPHHAVVTPGKETTKVRVVFDASSKATPNSPSLNEVMYRGPVFLNDLVGMLLRFRLPKVAIVSDVEKAFLQISLAKEHRDVTRFLWVKDPSQPPTKGNIVVYRYARVAFGMKASPFMLAGTIIYHMKKAGTKVALEIKDSTYMDNNFGGREDTQGAIAYYEEAKGLFRQMSMNLREWYSNDKAFLAVLPEKDRGKSHSPSVLGLKWNTEKDTLRCAVAALPSGEMKTTKRRILQFVASAFDPCGWFCAVTIRGKMLMQDLWKSKISWDEAISENDLLRWHQIRTDIAAIPGVEMERRLDRPEGLRIVHELHVFSDASSKAYAAAVYLKTESELGTSCYLVSAKARVAPVKAMTIPKLELTAVLLGVRMLQFVATELKLQIHRKFAWTDSTCVLGWLNSEKINTVFVENRLREIRRSTEIAFGHVKTEENPADFPSRGVELDSLRDNELWWKGPVWLRLAEEKWPRKASTYVPTTPLEELDIVTRTEGRNVIEVDPLIDASKFSSLARLLRVTAYVFRAVGKMRAREEFPTVLSAEEIIRSLTFWEKRVQKGSCVEEGEGLANAWKNKIKQLGLYKDEEGFFRCGGRYRNSQLLSEAQNPKLLPANHPFTKLVIKSRHAMVMHSGLKATLASVRQCYWIPDGRSAVKKILVGCQLCRRNFGGPFRTPDDAPLPEFRSQLKRPFAAVGLDYLGPLYVRVEGQEERQKAWVALFTCAAVRAVHLEPVNSLSAKDFLLSLRRFMALYGKPDLIVSDNAKQFKAGFQVLDRLWQEVQQNDEVQNFASSQGISWKFIAEKSPWMGGFYERLVALVKKALKATLGRWTVTATELHTLLYEVAFVLNGRPLTYSDDDPADLVITPLHLLFRSRDMFPEAVGDVDPADKMKAVDELLAHWKAGQNLLREFWNIWRDHYLLSLRESWRPRRERGTSNIPVELGAVVLVKEQLPRGRWKVGRISKLRKSGDGQIRSVEVVLPGGSIIVRPIKLLYPIEGACAAADDTVRGEDLTDITPQASGHDEKSSRPTRRAAVAARERTKRCLE